MSVDQWAARITARWQETVAGILDVSRMLVAAKKDVGHGNWYRLVGELPFGVDTAERLLKVASSEILANPDHGRVLPPSWQTLYELSKLKADQFEGGVAAGIIRPDMDRKDAIALRRKPKGEEHELTVVPRAGRFHLIQAAVDALDEVDDETVDVILTDPPYPREYLPVYAQLAETAARVLRPGGSCFAMIGQSFLPEILAAMAPHLTYNWTLAYLTPGGQSAQLWQRKVNTFWKPVLWFVKGSYEGKWLGDVAKSEPNDNDKRFHHWGQSESGMLDLVRRCTEPGDTVLDPFCGGGATGVAAVALNRLFIGSDIDADHLATSRDRLLRVVDETTTTIEGSAEVVADAA